jgi:hypothetical protein
MKIMEEQGVGAHSLTRNTLGLKGRVKAPRWGLGRVTSLTYSHKLAQIKQQVG